MWRFKKLTTIGQRCLHIGEQVAGWTLKDVAPINEFNMVATRLEHKCGSELVHVKRQDPNRTFSVGFRTLPDDSTGLPHILEHTTLCGSEKYPCRDPFFNMLNRSLATFMNAMTAPDYTFYPFSTQNTQDYKNLQSVYLDAVFSPRLANSDFRQEGWRLEHADPKDSSTPINLKGVVYNEMKGVFSDNQNLFNETLLNSLLPSNTYGVCSGGDPLDIPKLKHEDLIAFHRKHYTPGNAKFFIYGDAPVNEYIEAITPYLQKTSSRVPEVPSEPRWKSPKRKHIASREDPMAADQNKQGSIGVSFLCSDIRNVEESFILSVLTQLLVGGPNCPFYKTLVEPGIGAGLLPSTGYEGSTRDTFFTVGLQGVSTEDFTKIEEIVEQTFQNVVEEGFPMERIEAILHGIELGLKHQSANFGLSVLFGIMPLWIHGGNVLETLQIEKKMTKLRESLKQDPKYFQNKVAQYFVNNPHRLVLTMSPDPAFEDDQKKKEEAILADKLSKLSDEEKKKIFTDGLELLKDAEINNKDVLPTLRLSDIQENVVKVPVEESEVSGVPLAHFVQPTNGITYFRALLPTDNLSESSQAFLPILAHVCSLMGTKKRNFRELDQAISLATGGLNADNHVTVDVESSAYEGSLLLTSHCLDRNIPDMFQLWSEVLNEIDLSDANRFTTLVKSLAADCVNSIAGSGHRYAMLAASSLVSESSLLQEKTGGLTHVALLKKLAGGENGAGLAEIKAIVSSLRNSQIRCSVNSLSDTKLTPLSQMLKDLNWKGTQCLFRSPSAVKPEKLGRFYVLPFDVSYASSAIPTVPYSHLDFAPLRVLTMYLTRKYLHPEIREKGGAYGGGLTISTSGLLRFYSYRDPLPHRSLLTFDQAAEWYRKNPSSDLDIAEAKLGVFQQIDAPVAPGARGTLRFLHGITDEVLQEHRLRLKAVTTTDLLRVAEKYLDRPSLIGRCVLGPANQDILSEKTCNWSTVES